MQFKEFRSSGVTLRLGVQTYVCHANVLYLPLSSSIFIYLPPTRGEVLSSLPFGRG